EVNAQAAKTNATLRVRIHRDRAQAGDKIDHAVFLPPRLHFAAEKIFLPGEPIGKLVGNVEDKVRRIVDVHDQRQIVRGGKPDLLSWAHPRARESDMMSPLG